MNEQNVNKELYNYVISEAKEMALTGVKTAMVPTSLLYVDSTYPVSYTHLDVYKRQTVRTVSQRGYGRSRQKKRRKGYNVKICFLKIKSSQNGQVRL